MKTTKILLFLLVLLILQMTIFSKISIIGIRPDLLLVCVIIFSVYAGTFEGFLIGLLTGFIVDSFSLTAMTYMISFSATGFVCGFLKEYLVEDSEAAPYVFVVVGTFFAGYLINWQITNLFGRHTGELFWLLVISSLLNLILAPAINIAAKKIYGHDTN